MGEAQCREAKRAECQRLEDERAARLRRLTLEALARVEEGERVKAWRLAVACDVLEATLDAWEESGRTVV